MSRRRHKWDPDTVVAALRQRMDKGLPLHTGAIQKASAGLHHAIRRYFVSHDAAVRAAGIDPASVRRGFPWDKARVIAALQARQKAGLPVNRQAIFHDDQPLSGAITRFFGSGDPALRAAGIDPKTVRRNALYKSKADVIFGLRARHATGHRMKKHIKGQV